MAFESYSSRHSPPLEQRMELRFARLEERFNTNERYTGMDHRITAATAELRAPSSASCGRRSPPWHSGWSAWS
ncbi:MAG: hypothetical protein ACRD07_08835 [Acidimicrobiales bacterium]